MDTKISSDIPIPALGKRGRVEKYPFNLLKVGESFMFSETQNASDLSKARSLCYVKSKENKSFRSARHETHIRVWRIS